MNDETPSIKRIIFRLKSNGSSLGPIQIVNKYLLEVGLSLNKGFESPHYIHEQPQEERVYHIVLDVYPDKAVPEIRIQDIPTELYRVHFKKSALDP